MASVSLEVFMSFQQNITAQLAKIQATLDTQNAEFTTKLADHERRLQALESAAQTQPAPAQAPMDQDQPQAHPPVSRAQVDTLRKPLNKQLELATTALYLHDSNGRMENMRRLGNDTNHFINKMRCAKLVDIPRTVAGFEGTPDVVIIGCLSNDICELSNNNNLNDAQRKERLSSRIKTAHQRVKAKFPDKKRAILNSTPILEPVLRTWSNTHKWADDVDLRGGDADVIILATDYQSLATITKLGGVDHSIYPLDLMYDLRHCTGTALEARESVMRDFLNANPHNGDAPDVSEIFAKLRQIREDNPVQSQPRLATSVQRQTMDHGLIAELGMVLDRYRAHGFRRRPEGAWGGQGPR